MAKEFYAASPFSEETSAADVFMYRGEECIGIIAPIGGNTTESPGAEPLDTQTGGRRRAFGRIMRGLDALAAARLHSEMPIERQEVLLSAGGFGVGSFWTSVPTELAQRCTNAQWIMALRQRLSFEEHAE